MSSPATAPARAASGTARPAGRSWSALELLPAAVLLVLGALLLRPGYGLWYDELYTAEVARAPLGEILAAAVRGTGTAGYLAGIPPSYNLPYYVVVHLWTTVPGLGGDTSLRVLSLLATAGGLALTTRAVTRLAGTGTGVLAGTVLALTPLVLEQAVEARSYGLAVLASGATVLGLARWLQGAPRGLLLFGLAGAATGLMHWYAVTVPAALVVAALVLRGRRALPVLVAGAAAALPTVALVGLNLVSGNGSSNAAHVLGTGGQLPRLALEVWAGGQLPLVLLLLVLMAVGAARAEGVRVVAACWALVPLVLLTLGDLVRPLFWPRYLLAGLLGVGVLAAAGAWALPRLARWPAAVLLVALTATATQPVLDRGPREQGDDLVAWLVEVQVPGEPVVAADTRSALSVDHFTRTLAPRLRDDLVLPPEDAPADADRVWLVRREYRGGLWGTDDDDLLLAAGLAPERSWTFPGSKTRLVVQLWTR